MFLFSRTFAMLTPDGIKNMSKIIKNILNEKFKICNLRMLKLTSDMIGDIFSDKKESQEFP